MVVVSDRYFTVKAGGTYLRNAVALDPALSVDAVGLLMVMLAMHPRAPKNRDSLVGRGMGRDRVAKALRCLEAAGLRYRFRASGRKPGTWETLTLLFDEPVSVEQAWASINPAMAAAVVACVSHPQDSADVVRGTETCTPVDSDGVSGVRVSDRRKPVRPPKGVNNSSLHSELPPRHPSESDTDAVSGAGDSADGADHEGAGSVGPASPVKCGAGVASSAGSGKRSELLPEVDWELINECVPQPMAGWLAGLSARRVTGLLRQAVDAGWRPGRVYGALNAARLPAEVANGPGLVIHRVGQIAHTAPPVRRAPRAAGAAGEAVSAQSGVGGAVESSAAERAATIARLRGNGRLSGPMVEGLVARLSGSDGASGRSAGAGVADRQFSAVEARGCVRAPGLSPEEGRS